VAIGRREEIQQMFGRAFKDSLYVKVRSLQLEIPGSYPSLFTVALPFFWAMVLAIRWTRRTLRVLFTGTGVLLITAVLLTAFEVVRAFIVYTHLNLAGGFDTLLRDGDFAALNVIPYLAPVLLALYLDGDFREAIFFREPVSAVPTPAGTKGLGRGRGRHRWRTPENRHASTG